MNKISTPSAYGDLIAPATLKIERVLPGPIERVWSYLTDSNLRRKWLAAGEMDLKAGAPFEFVWRNDELTNPPGARPDGFEAEHRMKSTIVTVDPPRGLTFTWGATQSGEVSITLAQQGDEVLLTIIHRRLPDRGVMLNVSAGWHSHLDLLVAQLRGTKTSPHWDHFMTLKQDYDRRLPS